MQLKKKKKGRGNSPTMRWHSLYQLDEKGRGNSPTLRWQRSQFISTRWKGEGKQPNCKVAKVTVYSNLMERRGEIALL